MDKTKYVSSDEAVSHIPSGAHIHLSSVASVPHCLVDALCRRADAGEVTGLKFHHFHTEGLAPYSEERYEGVFTEQGFFVGANVRQNVNNGYADLVPVNLSDAPKLYRERIIPLGAALVQVSLPDESGMVSLGTSVDCSVTAVRSADLKIAVVNPNVPFSYGDLLHVSDFDYLVYDETPLIAKSYADPTETDEKIASFCSDLIEDGDCLQMGIGSLPNAIANNLVNHRNLGLHSEMFSDGLLKLMKSGVINGACKKIDRCQVVASFLLGSQDVYDYIDHNPTVQMRGIEYTNNPWVIAQNPNFKSVNSAVEIDITGQVCADSIGTRIFSGAGGQLDFVRGANLSPGGRSIIALASRTKKGKAKIVPTLTDGAGVVTPRSDVHYVVTEYGAVNLAGRSLQERAKLLISIAHPDDREALDKAAFERFGKHYHNFSI